MPSPLLRSLGRLGILGLTTVFFFPIATAAHAAAGEPVPLSGDWLVAVPAGFDQPQTITHLYDNRYRLSRLNHAGIYRLEGDTLIMDIPDDPRLTEFVWRVTREGNLVLIGEPPASKTGGRYLGTVMRPTGNRSNRMPATPAVAAPPKPVTHSTGGSF